MKKLLALFVIVATGCPSPVAPPASEGSDGGVCGPEAVDCNNGSCCPSGYVCTGTMCDSTLLSVPVDQRPHR